MNAEIITARDAMLEACRWAEKQKIHTVDASERRAAARAKLELAILALPNV